MGKSRPANGYPAFGPVRTMGPICCAPFIAFHFGIEDIGFPGLLCIAANVFNATHATDERVFVQPAETDGRAQDKISYS